MGETIEELRALAALGVEVGHGGLRDAWDVRQFEIFAKEIIPAAESF